MDKEIFILYYDLPKVYNEIGVANFMENIINPVMDKFDNEKRCAILLPKDITSYELMTKEEALEVIEKVKEYVEKWPE